MKTTFQKTSNWLSKHKAWAISVFIIILIIVSTQVFLGKKKPVYETLVLQSKDLQEVVSVTGHVKPADSADLAFEKGGIVSSIGPKVGDKVSYGQKLISLVSSDLEAQLSQSQAVIEKEQARLEEIKAGTRPEEIALQEANVSKTKISLGDAATGLVQSARDAYSKVDDAVRAKIDIIFTNPKSQNPKLIFNTDFSAQIDIEAGRVLVENRLVQAESKLVVLSDSSLIDSGNVYDIKPFSDLLIAAKDFADIVANAVNSQYSNSGLSQITIDTWKTNVSGARANIGMAVTNLQASIEKFQLASATFKVENNRLALEKAGPVVEQVSAQESMVAQAIANKQNVEAQLAKYVLRAPFDGTLTKQDVVRGEMVSPGQKVAAIISTGRYEMEAYIPEADIAKVKVGNKANVTLDAYGQDVFFPAEVYQIEPAETMIEGVATYKIKLRFVQEDERIKSGMTANIDLITEEIKGALSIPYRAISSRDGKKFVQVLLKGVPTEVSITTGVRSSDGLIEVLAGLKIGDDVIVSTK